MGKVELRRRYGRLWDGNGEERGMRGGLCTV